MTKRQPSRVSGPRVGPILIVDKPTRRSKEMRGFLDSIREGRFTDSEWAELWLRLDAYRAEGYQHGFMEGSKLY
jgi:hypothetical protein